MKKNSDIFLSFYTEHSEWSRHHESQRALVSNLIVTISSVLIGIITYDDLFDRGDVLISLFVALLGFFGIFFSLKHYLQFKFHDARVNFYKEKLYEIIEMNDINYLALEKELDLKTRGDSIVSKINLYAFWIVIHLFIIVIGLIIFVMSI